MPKALNLFKDNNEGSFEQILRTVPLVKKIKKWWTQALNSPSKTMKNAFYFI